MALVPSLGEEESMPLGPQVREHWIGAGVEKREGLEAWLLVLVSPLT